MTDTGPSEKNKAAVERIEFDALPNSLPIFPLAGVLLLPGGRLPLNIFEARYLAMTRDALAGNKLIGMVQPIDPRSRAQKPDVYRVGCAGRITASEETGDGRILITLAGLCRFNLIDELTTTTPYRQVSASFARYRPDLDPVPADEIDRERLLRALRDFVAANRLQVEWPSVEQAPNDILINSLAMLCPFAPNEKQALLEAANLGERARVMTTLIEMALLNRGGAGDKPLH